MTGASLGYSGYHSSTSLSDVGVVGEWWQSAVRDSIYSYRLYIDANGNIYPWHYGSKYFGRTVR